MSYAAMYDPEVNQMVGYISWAIVFLIFGSSFFMLGMHVEKCLQKLKR